MICRQFQCFSEFLLECTMDQRNIIHRTFTHITRILQLQSGLRIVRCASKIPSKQLRLIQAWIEIHREELLADWTLCQNGEKPFQIDPLK
jgi:hypothetical protein